MCSNSLKAPVVSSVVLLLLTFFTIGAYASTGTAIPDSPQREALAARFIQQDLRVWQDRMNLKEWNLQVKLVRATELEPKTLGNIHWDLDEKAATICVLSPADYPLADNPMLADMEFTIVHELVHLELASLPRSDASRRIEERAVNEIASALLRLAQPDKAR